MISISSCPSLPPSHRLTSPSLGSKHKGAIDSFPHLESSAWSGEGEIIVLRRHIYQYPSLPSSLPYSPFPLLFHCFVCKSSPTAEMQIFIFSRRGISQVTTKNRTEERGMMRTNYLQVGTETPRMSDEAHFFTLSSSHMSKQP